MSALAVAFTSFSKVNSFTNRWLNHSQRWLRIRKKTLAIECGGSNYIVCVYEKDQRSYVAKVEEIDEDDNDLHVLFMTPHLSFNSRAHVIFWFTRLDLL